MGKIFQRPQSGEQIAVWSENTGTLTTIAQAVANEFTDISVLGHRWML
jgi:hypothetical protein